MARGLGLLLAVAACGAARPNGTPDPVRAAAARPPTKVLVIINGAFVPNTEYAGLARAVQDAAPMPLWVAIRGTLDCPNPATIGRKIEAALAAVDAAGFAGALEADDGRGRRPLARARIFAQTRRWLRAGTRRSCSSARTSRRPPAYSVDTYGAPVLTLGGASSTASRASRASRSRGASTPRCSPRPPRPVLDGAAAANGALAYSRAVVVLPGVTHSLFCDAVNVTSFGAKDKCAFGTSRATRARAMSAATGAFLALRSAGGVCVVVCAAAAARA